LEIDRDSRQGMQEFAGQEGPAPSRVRADNAFRPKNLMGVPWRVALALQDDGWNLRQDIIWYKPNAMPESVTDRCTKAHEYLFLLSKSERYYWDSEAMQEDATGALPGNVNHKHTVEYESGNEKMRTKAGLLDYALRQRSKRDGFKREDSKRAALIPGQSKATHRPDRPEGEGDLTRRNRRSVWTVATKPYNGKKALTDYVGDDGKPYTASPGCPIHGHLARRQTPGTHGCGGQQGQSQTGSAGTCDHHAQSPACGEQPTTSRSSQASAECNSQQHTTGSSHENKTDSRLNGHTSVDGNQSCSGCKSASGEHQDCGKDCSRQSSSSTAIFHNTEASKTALALATTQPCMPCAETGIHTQSTQDQHGLFEQGHGTCESSILTGETSVHLSQDIHSCNVGKSSELASMAYVVEKKCTCKEVIIDHFATFPPALIEPCILASTRPGDVVLDPFMGSGTTAQVAQQLGRRWIGCELNPEYAALQQERTAQLAFEI